MIGVEHEQRPARRRRRPGEAEREILDAAEAFLSERPFAELTIDEVMARTGLSRPAFYVSFRDRHALATRILERVGAELFEIDRGWLEGTGGDSRSLARDTLAAGAAFFGHRGPLLRAIADAAASDPEVERLYRFGLLEQFAAAVSARIDRGVAEGEMLVVTDPGAVGRALVLMTERYLLDTVARGPDVDPEPVVAALAEIWVRTLYGPE